MQSLYSFIYLFVWTQCNVNLSMAFCGYFNMYCQSKLYSKTVFTEQPWYHVTVKKNLFYPQQMLNNIVHNVQCFWWAEWWHTMHKPAICLHLVNSNFHSSVPISKSVEIWTSNLQITVLFSVIFTFWLHMLWLDKLHFWDVLTTDCDFVFHVRSKRFWYRDCSIGELVCF